MSRIKSTILTGVLLTLAVAETSCAQRSSTTSRGNDGPKTVTAEPEAPSEGLLRAFFTIDDPIDGFCVDGEITTDRDMHLWEGKCHLKATITRLGDGMTYEYTDDEFGGMWAYDEVRFDGRHYSFTYGDGLKSAQKSGLSEYEGSQLPYCEPFAFIDVDFDGKKEFLVSDGNRGQGGNNYGAYHLDKALFKLTYWPLDGIDNSMQFDYADKSITVFKRDGAYDSCKAVYRKVDGARPVTRKHPIDKMNTASAKWELGDYYESGGAGDFRLLYIEEHFDHGEGEKTANWTF